MVALMALALYDIFTAEDRVAVVQTVYFYQTMFIIFTMWLFLLIFLTFGARINQIMETQSRTLSGHALRLSDEIDLIRNNMTRRLEKDKEEKARDEDEDEDDEGVEVLVERLQQAHERVESCRDVIDYYASFKPYKLMGVKVEFSMIISVLTGGITFAATMLSFVSDSEESSTYLGDD
mmetsp:Transcript_20311/g.34590  ORF Transcript_20311/g.34590 Transcript_20311/m.34590 type:complete len:178 (-) Transcript_20311:2388-2921(-)